MTRANRKNLVYLLIVFIPFLFFFFKSDISSSLKFKFIQLSAPPAQIITRPVMEAKKILFYHRTFKEYKKLRRETDILKARLIGMEEVIKENSRLEKLLEFKRRLIYPSAPANVIGRNPSQWNSSIIIDKGQRDGISVGQPVVNALGVVGKVAEVSAKKSKVILLTDPQFSVAALVQRPRESVLISGSLQGLCRIRYVDLEADIKEGDQIITSKLSSSFPESLYIGEVIEIKEKAHSPQKEYVVQPAVTFSQLEEVLVILMDQQ